MQRAVIKIKANSLKNNMQLLLFILALVLFYLILEPLINIFLASIIFAYVFSPVHRKIKKKIGYESISIFLTLFIIVILFLIPFLFIATNIPSQVAQLREYVDSNVIGQDLFEIDCEGSTTVVCSIINVLSQSEVVSLEKIFDAIFAWVADIVKSIVFNVPSFIVGIGFALFISYFLFKDGKRIVEGIARILPFEQKYSMKLIDQFEHVTYSVVFAHLIVAIVQGILGTIGFYIFGIESPIFWGVIMAVFALLPVIGPAIIWIPAAGFLIISGLITNSYFIIGKGIGLFLFGFFLISTIDNILRVKLVGGGADVHPLTVLIGLIGGVSMFGLIGIFVGPIVLSLLVTYIKDFSQQYKEG